MSSLLWRQPSRTHLGREALLLFLGLIIIIIIRQDSIYRLHRDCVTRGKLDVTAFTSPRRHKATLGDTLFYLIQRPNQRATRYSVSMETVGDWATGSDEGQTVQKAKLKLWISSLNSEGCRLLSHTWPVFIFNFTMSLYLMLILCLFLFWKSNGHYTINSYYVQQPL